VRFGRCFPQDLSICSGCWSDIRSLTQRWETNRDSWEQTPYQTTAESVLFYETGSFGKTSFAPRFHSPRDSHFVSFILLYSAAFFLPLYTFHRVCHGSALPCQSNSCGRGGPELIRRGLLPQSLPSAVLHQNRADPRVHATSGQNFHASLTSESKPISTNLRCLT